MNIVQVERVRDTLLVILLRGIFLFRNFNLSKRSIVIDGDLRVSGEDLAALGDNKWIDLNHITVFF